MQLFTIGTVLLNEDGTSQLDENGNEIETYSTEVREAHRKLDIFHASGQGLTTFYLPMMQNIVNFARAWTGYNFQSFRGNIEYAPENYIDPMTIEPAWRDMVRGDIRPTCNDRPSWLLITTLISPLSSSQRLTSRVDTSAIILTLFAKTYRKTRT